MKFALPGMILFTLAGFPLGSTVSREPIEQASHPEPTRSPVIVELFTSEGCSTCPPADQLLARLEAEQSIDRAEVIAIEEHVDYWNQQGWTDPFSAAEWTQRQQEYAARFKLDGVYTPQMIVDGQKEFIGSRIREVVAGIAESARGSKARVAISTTNSNDKETHQFAVTVGPLEGSTEGDAVEVWLAITEKGLHSAVSRGENSGKELHHASILRSLRRIGSANPSKGSASFSGTVSLKAKSAWKRENLRVIVFAQGKKNRRILGAASLTIPD